MQCEYISEHERFKSLAAVSGLFYKNMNCRISLFFLPFFAFFIKLCNLLSWKAIFLRNLYFFKKRKGDRFIKSKSTAESPSSVRFRQFVAGYTMPFLLSTLRTLKTAFQVLQNTVGLTDGKWSTFRCS